MNFYNNNFFYKSMPKFVYLRSFLLINHANQ